MARFSIGIGLVAIMAMLSSCTTPAPTSPKLSMTYCSDPAGANLYQDGIYLGRCPHTLNFILTDEQRIRGEVYLQEVTARWVSGATKSSGVIRVDLWQHGYSQQVTLPRPADAPDVEVDAAYAIEMQRSKIARVRAKAESERFRLLQRQTKIMEEQERRAKYREMMHNIHMLNRLKHKHPPPKVRIR